LRLPGRPRLKPILIKRYGRRRFFHVDDCRFLSAEELARLKQNGFDVVIREAGTGEDITEVLIGE
jgi:polyhydroxyalkanoate synthesis regulator protein